MGFSLHFCLLAPHQSHLALPADGKHKSEERRKCNDGTRTEEWPGWAVVTANTLDLDSDLIGLTLLWRWLPSSLRQVTQWLWSVSSSLNQRQHQSHKELSGKMKSNELSQRWPAHSRPPVNVSREFYNRRPFVPTLLFHKRRGWGSARGSRAPEVTQLGSTEPRMGTSSFHSWTRALCPIPSCSDLHWESCGNPNEYACFRSRFRELQILELDACTQAHVHTHTRTLLEPRALCFMDCYIFSA